MGLKRWVFAIGVFLAVPVMAASPGPLDTVQKMMQLAEGHNLRQRALRDAWVPLFLTPDDCDRLMILLARKVAEAGFAEGRLRGYRIDDVEVDETFGFAKVKVRLRGRSDWWWPRWFTLNLTLKKVDGVWFLKGPRLRNIDKNDNEENL